MNNLKKSMKRVFCLFFALFLLMGGYLFKIVAMDSDSIITNSYNPRLKVDDPSIRRGTIFDINKNTMAYSEMVDGSYVRNYVYGQNSAHVLGYVDVGKAGIEASRHFMLETADNELIQRLSALLNQTEVKGNDLVLTVDMNLQRIGQSLLGDNKGAIVVMEVATGRVVSMVSSPSYDPQTVGENWDVLRIEEDSPLLNRCTQGLYTPGSTFKTITALAALRTMPDAENFTYECKGVDTYKDKVIHCSDNKVHGTVNLKSAFAQSCNCYFAALGNQIGAEAIAKTAQDLGLGTNLEFELPSSLSSMGLEKDATESEIVETSIGQGETVVTPLYMASFASAIANGGVMMKPYVVDHWENYAGKVIETQLPQQLDTIMSREEADTLKDMMIAVVNEGTGRNANSEYFQVAGKTGTAENPHGTPHLWFIGFAPAQEPKYAVAVVLENASGSANASVIARKMLYNAINPS